MTRELVILFWLAVALLAVMFLNGCASYNEGWHTPYAQGGYGNSAWQGLGRHD